MNKVEFTPIPPSITYMVPPPSSYNRPVTVDFSQESIFSFEWIKRGGHRLCSKILFPSSDGVEWEEKRIKLQEEFQAQRVSLESPDGSQLDGMLFPSTSKDAQLAKKAILFAPGADGFYEDNFSYYLVKLIKRHVGNINILIVNYPVMASKGELNLESMKLTIFSGCSFLINERDIKPDDLIVYGQSLGGVASIKGTLFFQQTYPDAMINVINERSFADFPSVVQHTGGRVLGFLGRKLFESNNWQTPHIEEEFNSLRGQKFVIYSKYDGVVGKSNTLYKRLKSKKAFLTTDVKVLFMEGSKVQASEHMRQFSAKEEIAIGLEMRNMLGLPTPSDLTASLVVKTLKAAADVFRS
ncbi:alpha/beta hydrolase [Candidatus Protochlamydia phocaeensis]|uniref:alpha/beta hydrolase n=1 Tax=Candidatus Protochlamydia phocaeensis TaxID=1414722 RepID=UPI00083981A3|nr:hypothetical protein [Candidatus Protochlamydia phocaeensis]